MICDGMSVLSARSEAGIRGLKGGQFGGAAAFATGFEAGFLGLGGMVAVFVRMQR